MGERGGTKVEIIDELMSHLKIIDEISHFVLMFCLKLWSPCLFLKIILSSVMPASGVHRFMCLIQE